MPWRNGERWRAVWIYPQYTGEGPFLSRWVDFHAIVVCKMRVVLLPICCDVRGFHDWGDDVLYQLMTYTGKGCWSVISVFASVIFLEDWWDKNAFQSFGSALCWSEAYNIKGGAAADSAAVSFINRAEIYPVQLPYEGWFFSRGWPFYPLAPLCLPWKRITLISYMSWRPKYILMQQHALKFN